MYNNGKLTVTFNSGAIYEYTGVDANTVNAIQTSTQPGSLFHKLVKQNPKVGYKRIK